MNSTDQLGVAQNYGPVPANRPSVLEQNLDGNGNIKVHEQGDCERQRVTNGGTRSGHSGSPEQRRNPDNSFVSTGDCARLDVFLTVSGGSSESSCIHPLMAA